MTLSADPFGPTRRWKDGDILYAENGFVRIACVVATHPSMVGSMGWEQGVMVDYVSPEVAKLWDDGETGDGK